MLNEPKIGNLKEIHDWMRDITKILNNFVDVVAITVSAGSATGSSVANKYLVGGTIVGYQPTGNQDQFVDNIVINTNGSITLTLAANAIAVSSFNVIIRRLI
jgi:hypothetical protein